MAFFFFVPPLFSNLFSLSLPLKQKHTQEVPSSTVSRDWIEGLDTPTVVRRKRGESVAAAAAAIGLSLPKFDGDDGESSLLLSCRQRRHRRKNWFLPKNLAALLGGDDPSNSSSCPRFRALDPQGNEAQLKWTLGEQWVSYSAARGGGGVASVGRTGAGGNGTRRGRDAPATTAALAGAATPAATAAALVADAAVAAPASENGGGAGEPHREEEEEEEDEEADEADSTRIVRPAAGAASAALPLPKKSVPTPPRFSSRGISLESKRRLLVAEVRLCGDGEGEGGSSNSPLSKASRPPAAVAGADLVASLFLLEGEAAALIRGIAPAGSKLSLHPAGGFSDWRLPAAGAAGWRFALGCGEKDKAKSVPRVVLAAPLSAGNAATFAAWARGAPRGAVALVKSLEGVVRSDLGAGDAVFLPPGWLVCEATPPFWRSAAARIDENDDDEPDSSDDDENDDDDDEENEEEDEDEEASFSLFGGSACLSGQALLCSGWRQHAAASRLEDSLGIKPKDRQPGLERLAWVSAKCWAKALKSALPSAAKRAALGLAVAALAAKRRQARQEVEAAAAAARAEAEAEAAARVLAGALGGEREGGEEEGGEGGEAVPWAGGGEVPWAEDDDEGNQQQQQRPKTGLKFKLGGLKSSGGTAATSSKNDNGGGNVTAAAAAASSPKVSVKLRLPTRIAAAAALPPPAPPAATSPAAPASAAAPPPLLAPLRPSILSALPHLSQLLREWSLLPLEVLAAASAGHADPLAAVDALAEGIRAVAVAAAAASASAAAETTTTTTSPDSLLSLLFSSPTAAAEAAALAALPPPVVLPAAFDADEAAPILPFRWGEEDDDGEGGNGNGYDDDDEEFHAFGGNFEEEAGDSFDGFDGGKSKWSRKRRPSGTGSVGPSRKQQQQRPKQQQGQQQRPRSAVGETPATTAGAKASSSLLRKQFPASPKLASKSVKDRLKKKLKLR